MNNTLGALMITIIFLFIVITPIVLFIKYKIKKEDKQRFVDIDISMELWKQVYQKENFKMPELTFDKYLDVKKSENKYIRMKKNTYHIDDFYEKDFNSHLRLREYCKVFGEVKGVEYFNNGFELGLTKTDIITILGQPKESKKEVLKTKETLYYSYIKSDNYYVFDDDILVKIVK